MPGINRMYVFTNCNFTAYYPEGDETWDGIEEIEFQNAKIKWVPYKVANVMERRCVDGRFRESGSGRKC